MEINRVLYREYDDWLYVFCLFTFEEEESILELGGGPAYPSISALVTVQGATRKVLLVK